MHEEASTDGVAPSRLVLGRCTLDRAAGELFTAKGEPAELRKQALDVLLVLGRRAGQVVSKDELMSQVWPKVVVGEGSLTQAIADLRRGLGDDEHRLVRTVARRGYMLVPDERPPVVDLQVAMSADRLVAPADSHPLSPVVPTPQAIAGTPSSPAAQPARLARRNPVLMGALALATAFAAAGTWLVWRNMAPPPTWQSPTDQARAPLPG